MHTHIHTRTHMYTHTHVHTHTYTHICTHTHTHTHSYTHTHTHTHTRFTFTGASLDWTISTVTASEGCVCTGMYKPGGESTPPISGVSDYNLIYALICMGLQCFLLYILCYFHIIICCLLYTSDAADE